MIPRAQREPVTVGIVNYNGVQHLPATIRSLRSMQYPIERMLMADDGSTDGSVDFIRRHFPEITVIRMHQNTKRANYLRNVLLRKAGTRLVFLIDNDLNFDAHCLDELVRQMHQLPDAAMCTARVMEKEDPKRIYSDGNVLNYICNSISENRGELAEGKSRIPKVSIGCIGNQLVDKEKAALIDFHDEDMSVGWGDDGEFHHRLLMVGYKTYLIPAAIAYHSRKTQGFRTVAQVKNRAFFILKNYSFKTVCLIFPALVVYEICIILFLIIKKDIGAYGFSIKEIISHLPRTMRKRSTIQRLRRVSDKHLMTSGPLFLFSHLVDNKPFEIGLAVLNRFFIGYWKLIRNFL
jgi:GT2 family glycosyltransferase